MIGIVIPVWLTDVEVLWESTRKALSSLSASSPARVYVVPNRLHRMTEEPLREHLGGFCPHPVVVLPWDGARSVAASWNQGLRMAIRDGCDRFLVTANDCYWRPGAVDRLLAYGENPESVGISLWSGSAVERPSSEPVEGCDFTGFCLRSSTLDTAGWFDERYRPCLAPDTPVLTDDLRWVPVASLKSGDGLVGVEEFNQPGRGGRRYLKSTVVGVRSLAADSYRLVLKDGREVVCSENHRWLTKGSLRSGMKWQWQSALELSVGMRIKSPLKTWRERDDFDSGWISGVFDGEGCVRRYGGGLGFAQKPGLVLDRAIRILTSHGVKFTVYPRTDNGVTMVEINDKANHFKVLGEYRPVRLLAKTWWDGMPMKSKGDGDEQEIVSIERVGETDVVDLCTTTATFLANGMVSHNSYFEDNDYATRVVQSGGTCRIVPTARFEHAGSLTLRSDPEAAHHVRHWFEINKSRYVAKWGRLPPTSEAECRETCYSTPWNDPSLTVRDWDR